MEWRGKEKKEAQRAEKIELDALSFSVTVAVRRGVDNQIYLAGLQNLGPISLYSLQRDSGAFWQKVTTLPQLLVRISRVE